VPFSRQRTGWEKAHAALFLKSNESSCIDAHRLFLGGGRLAGIVRGSNAFSGWLAACRRGPQCTF
jgi:hypothetical protein